MLKVGGGGGGGTNIRLGNKYSPIFVSRKNKYSFPQILILGGTNIWGGGGGEGGEGKKYLLAPVEY